MKRAFSYIYYFLLFGLNLNAQTAAIRILPDTQSVNIDSFASITVKLENIQELHAYSIEVSYDPVLLKFQSLTRMNFLNSWQTFYFPFIDTIAGKVKVDEAILGPYSQSGTGEIYKITFKGRSQGNCPLNITTNELRNLSNQSIQAVLYNSSIFVQPTVNIEHENEFGGSSNLLEIYPNPFNSATNIHIKSSTANEVVIRVFNIKGEMVFQYNTFANTGDIRLAWNGSDKYGQLLPSGVYFIRMEFDGQLFHKKVVMLK